MAGTGRPLTGRSAKAGSKVRQSSGMMAFMEAGLTEVKME
jgi:hypothetical protein